MVAPHWQGSVLLTTITKAGGSQPQREAISAEPMAVMTKTVHSRSSDCRREPWHGVRVPS